MRLLHLVITVVALFYSGLFPPDFLSPAFLSSCITINCQSDSTSTSLIVIAANSRVNTATPELLNCRLSFPFFADPSSTTSREKNLTLFDLYPPNTLVQNDFTSDLGREPAKPSPDPL